MPDKKYREMPLGVLSTWLHQVADKKDFLAANRYMDRIYEMHRSQFPEQTPSSEKILGMALLDIVDALASALDKQGMLVHPEDNQEPPPAENRPAPEGSYDA